jgi:hypothetical protein
MEPTQVKQLFINLFGESLDIYGLSVKLISVEWFRTTKLSNNYGFDFEITNPNDVSYYVLPVEWEIEEIIGEFTNYVDVKIHSNTFLKSDQGGLYFNKEKIKEIKTAFKKIDTIKFKTGTFVNGYDKYELKIDSVGYKKWFEHEQIRLDNVIKPISATKNGEPCDIDDAIFEYYEEFIPQQETYWETETLFQELDGILSSIPSIGSNDIVLMYETDLFHK